MNKYFAAIAPLNLPNSDRTPSTSQTAIAPPHSPKQRSHPLNSPNSDRTPSTPQHPFLTNHRDTEDTESFAQRRKESHFSPISFFNEPRRREEHEGRREEKSDHRLVCYMKNKYNNNKINHYF
ncbi:hypothetical protein [Dolichospermum sp. UHCC 0315A]|uniref:hypothetical protein n=1 Tax=Dolichospermum sp. UHCC 0315A TaxID=1914871 RepID=UPI0011E729E9|nr:hypothetical protein [Dolichospermum sp. UHCC 0315A]